MRARVSSVVQQGGGTRLVEGVDMIGGKGAQSKEWAKRKRKRFAWLLSLSFFRVKRMGGGAKRNRLSGERE